MNYIIAWPTSWNKIESALLNLENWDFDSALNACRQELENTLIDLWSKISNREFSVRVPWNWNVSTAQRLQSIIAILKKDIEKLSKESKWNFYLDVLSPLKDALVDIKTPIFEYWDKSTTKASKINHWSHSQPISDDENYTRYQVRECINSIEVLIKTYSRNKWKIKKYFS